MKIGLLLNANLAYSPYVKIYSGIMQEMQIDYSFLSWDRVNCGETEGLVYKKNFPYGNNNKITWILRYWKYSKFLKHHIELNRYDKLIVFGPQVGLFLYKFLNSNYKNIFCFDFRDLFIEHYFPKLFEKLLGISALNVISSPGFKEYLPKKFNYLISHNLNIKALEAAIQNNRITEIFSRDIITISTIGFIRDFNENYQVIKALSGKPDYLLKFIGEPNNDGIKLRQTCNTLKNVEFTDFFRQEDVPELISDADFINIYRPHDYTCSSTLTNRFYTALMYKKPMIVTKGSIEGSYVERFNLGLSIENCSSLDEQIKDFISSFNQQEFISNCHSLLREFKSDYDLFKLKFAEFLNSNC